MAVVPLQMAVLYHYRWLYCTITDGCTVPLQMAVVPLQMAAVPLQMAAVPLQMAGTVPLQMAVVPLQMAVVPLQMAVVPLNRHLCHTCMTGIHASPLTIITFPFLEGTTSQS